MLSNELAAKAIFTPARTLHIRMEEERLCPVPAKTAETSRGVDPCVSRPNP
jgi:hypothetical protein